MEKDRDGEVQEDESRRELMMFRVVVVLDVLGGALEWDCSPWFAIDDDRDY